MSLKIVRYHSFLWLSSVQLSCSVLSNLFQIPDFLIHHKLLEFANLISNKSLISSNHLILCHPLSPCFQSFPASEAFPMSLFFTSGDQSIGASASASVLPMNTQGWSPLKWTGWIFLQSKDSQESSPTPQFKSINSSVLRFLYSPTLTSVHDHWKNHNLV